MNETGIAQVMNWISENVDVIKLLFAVLGGAFALYQWRIQIVQRRAEKVKELICKVRDDPDIAEIMDVIDWDEGIEYDGKFFVNRNCPKEALTKISADDLFQKIDKTLSHFSFICYLRANRTLTKKDMVIFEYGLRRLADNPHIGNYLYSLHHWSNSLNVPCSFGYLITYAIRKGYFSKDFKSIASENYENYLKLSE